MPASPEIREILARAEAAQRRPRGPLEFGSVRGIAAWYARSRARMGRPHGLHPRTSRGSDGREYLVQVDGGRGGHLDDVLAGLLTVHAILEDARGGEATPQQWRAWWLVRVEGYQQNEAAEMVGASEASVSRWLGRIDRALRPTLEAAGMLVSRGDGCSL